MEVVFWYKINWCLRHSDYELELGLGTTQGTIHARSLKAPGDEAPCSDNLNMHFNFLID